MSQIYLQHIKHPLAVNHSVYLEKLNVNNCNNHLFSNNVSYKKEIEIKRQYQFLSNLVGVTQTIHTWPLVAAEPDR